MWGSSLDMSGRADVQFKPEGHQMAEFLLACGGGRVERTRSVVGSSKILH